MSKGKGATSGPFNFYSHSQRDINDDEETVKQLEHIESSVEKAQYYKFL